MGLKQSTYGRTLTLSLPSGIKVKARRPSVLTLIASGGFPSELTLEVWKLVKKDGLDPDKIAEDPESVKSWTKLMNAYLPFVLVDPKVVGGDAETELSEDEKGLVHGQVNVLDITDTDKQVIFLFGNNACGSDEELAEGSRRIGGSELVKELLKFRGGAARGDAGPGGEEVRAEAERDDRAAAVDAAGA